ncbi:hypothetical protein [Nonomuraea sp. NPDC050691]|uniref:hypothetical protein n=1 Tax=Nonomuraea sp. NPDC050691 TaxID=3155661 RepID=UPI0033ED80A1
MTDKQPTTIGRCYGCGRTFAYDPATVTMFSVDPETGFPPGMTVLGSVREPTPEAVARAVDKPVCPECVDKAKRFLDNADAPARWKPWPGPRP